MNEVFQKLFDVRTRNRFTYQDMAEKLGISKCYYWQIEHRRRRLYYDLAKKIAFIFDMKPDDLFFDAFED